MNTNKIENGLNNIANVLAQGRLKAPITNDISADYNLKTTLYTLNFNNLTYRYCTDGVFKTLIRQPVLDAFKSYRIISSELSQDQIKKIEEIIQDKNINDIVKESLYWNRLYGGSVVIIDKSNPDNLDYIVVNRWDLQNISNLKQRSNKGIYDSNVENDLYYLSQFLDKKNTIILKGEEAPYYISKILNGWGLSVAEPLVVPSNLYQKTLNLMYELIDESKIDVYNIANLSNSVVGGQEQEIVDRISIANKMKNFMNAIVLDGEDKFDQKQLGNLGNIVDILQEIKLDICSAVKIPAVILWGMSPSGFSSGEFDMKQYQDRLITNIQPDIKKVLLRIINEESQLLFNKKVDDIEFDNYVTLTIDQIEQSKSNKFNRILSLYNNKLLTKSEVMNLLQTDEIIDQGNYKSLSDNNYQTDTETLVEDRDYMGGQDDKNL